MTLRSIILHPDPRLKKPCEPVARITPEIETLAADMLATMYDAPGVGLAAPQVAVSQRLIVVRLPDDEESREEHGEEAGVIYVLANPKIIKSSKEMVTGVEACLSIPGYYGEVERHESVVITGQDRHGKNIRVKARGWLARVFQHEIDHLDGQLYIDIASEVWRARDDETEGEESKPVER